jgi:outer membrane protein assembly factor BamA
MFLPLRTALLLALEAVPVVLLAQGAYSGPFVLQGVVVNGNDRTQERIILREFTLVLGDTLARDELLSQLQRSQENIFNLRLFNRVTVLPVFLDSTHVIADVQVDERWYLWPSPILEIADPNVNQAWDFRDARRLNYGLYVQQYNFRGLNETLEAKVRLGYSDRFGLAYETPYIDRRQRLGLRTSAHYEQNYEITTGTREGKRIFHTEGEGQARTETKARIAFTLRPRHDLRHSADLAFTRTTLSDSALRSASGYLGNGTGNLQFLSTGYGLVLDRRDVRFFARNGYLAELSLHRDGLGLANTLEGGQSYAYTRLAKWWTLTRRTTVASSVRAKYTVERSVPYYLQSGIGYTHYVRGYEYYVVDGQDWVLAKQNVLFALLQPQEHDVPQAPLRAFRTLYLAVYWHAFVDVGYVNDRLQAPQNPLANSWLLGYGTGLSLVTSYDQVLRAELARNALGEAGFYLHFDQPF